MKRRAMSLLCGCLALRGLLDGAMAEETRFKMVAEQGGKVLAEKTMGSKTSPKTCPWSDGTELEPQY